MTREQLHQFDDLVDALWSGDVGEVEFTEVALELGARLDRINQALTDVREEDGVI